MIKENWYVEKEFEIAGAHHLNLPYDSPCKNQHGHNWQVTIGVVATELTPEGMVVDFSKIKKAIHGKLDHQNLNEILPHINPTAENLARWMANEVDKLCDNDAYCCKVKIYESKNNLAVYKRVKE